MPNVKVCLWNIQNYGQVAPKYDGTGYIAGNALRNQFIARFLREHDIDVLMIQECGLFASEAITDLQRKANALYDTKDWAYSICGSTISSSSVAQAQNLFDVGYTSGARTEGYAVLWRRSQAARFTLVDGLFPIDTLTGPASANLTSPLNMSELGRPTGTITTKEKVKVKFRTVDTFGAMGGFTQTNAYPYRLNPVNNTYALLAAWPRLHYPPTSASHYASLQWATVRRPVYVVLKLGNDATNLCPVAVYHAPSNHKRASWGAFIAGLSREVYATNVVNGTTPAPNQLRVARKAVLGGDFNWSEAQADWPGAYRYFTDGRSQNLKGGAACAAAPAPNSGEDARRTTVQILQGDHTTPIVSANTNAYLRHKIDLAFYFGGVTAERVDLMTEVMNNDVYQTPVEHAYDVMDQAEKDVTAPNLFARRQMTPTGPQEERLVERNKRWVQAFVPMICGAWGGTFTNWAETKRQFKAGLITDARRAGEFIHIFITDHLPLVATIPV